MKIKILLIGLTIISTISFGQITWEHSYQDIDRYSFTGVKLEKDGDKYFAYDDSITITLYNLDHTTFKTIVLDNLPSDSSYFYCYIKDVSQHVFNTSDDVEILLEYSYQNYNSETINIVEVVNENKSSLFKEENASVGFDNDINDGQFIFNTEQGLKLHILSENTTAKIYSLPGNRNSNDNSVDLSLINDTLFINNSSYVYLGDYSQQLSESNDTLYLSNGGYVFIGDNSNPDGSINIKTTTANQIEIYPTETSDLFYIDYSISSGSGSKLLFLNSSGSILEERELIEPTGEITMSTSNYPNGLYIVILISENGAVFSRNLIINK